LGASAGRYDHLWNGNCRSLHVNEAGLSLKRTIRPKCWTADLTSQLRYPYRLLHLPLRVARMNRRCPNAFLDFTFDPLEDLRNPLRNVMLADFTPGCCLTHSRTSLPSATLAPVKPKTEPFSKSEALKTMLPIFATTDFSTSNFLPCSICTLSW